MMGLVYFPNVGEVCADINCNNGACVATESGYRCDCDVGWTGLDCSTDSKYQTLFYIRYKLAKRSAIRRFRISLFHHIIIRCAMWSMIITTSKTNNLIKRVD